MKGHVLPATEVQQLDDEHAHLGVQLSGGERLCRCLRCDTWMERPDPVAATHTLQDIEQRPRPRRGKQLREALIIRLIAIDKAAHSIIFGIFFALLIVLELKLPVLHTWAAQNINDIRVAQESGVNLSIGAIVTYPLQRIQDLHQAEIRFLLVMAGIYTVLEGVEAWGLWRERRWAEYLTAVANAGFLPLEIYELSKGISILKVTALVINVFVLVWLIYKKRLFGLRGGYEALKAEHHEAYAPPQPLQLVHPS